MNRIKIHWYDYAVEGVVEGTDERVKRIDGYEWCFVTDEGRVLSARVGKTNQFDFDSLKEIKQVANKQGYQIVTLHDGGNSKNHLVHRLVAQAFIPNPDNLPVVNHLKFPSNRAEDLEWETQRGNVLKGKIGQGTFKRRPFNKIVPVVAANPRYGLTKAGKQSKIMTYTLEDSEGNRFVMDSIVPFCKERGMVTSGLYRGERVKGYALVARGE